MFYDHLTVKEDIRHGSFRHRLFHAFNFGVVSLSVQAGSGKYCSPKTDLDDLSKYESWEIAFLHSKKGLCRPTELEELPAGVKSFVDRAWPADDVAQVSTPVIETLFRCLCQEFGLPKRGFGSKESRKQGALQYLLGSVKEKYQPPTVRINASALRGKSL